MFFNGLQCFSMACGFVVFATKAELKHWPAIFLSGMCVNQRPAMVIYPLPRCLRHGILRGPALATTGPRRFSEAGRYDPC
jgi:hypothetical protein